MPKQDTVRRIDLTHSASGNGTPAQTTIVGSGSGYAAHTVDGFHASATPTENSLLPLGSDRKFPASVIPDVLASDGLGYGGIRYYGPTTYLTRGLLLADEFIHVAQAAFPPEEYLVLSTWGVPNTTVQITGAARYESGEYVYPIRRFFRTAEKDRGDYPVGTQVIGIGLPGAVGGFLTLNSSGQGAASPNLSAWTNESDTEATWRLTLGRLGGIKASTDPAQVAFVANFPNWTDDDWTTFGLAARNVALDGEFAVAGGTIYGDLDVTGTIRISGDPGLGEVQIGDTEAGFGWLLRGASGPAVMALSPYADDDGVISPVAFVINHSGSNGPGLYYHEIPNATDPDGLPEGILEINVNTLVSGNFRVGQTFLVGTGDWGPSFAGVAIDSEWGLVGLADGDTFLEGTAEGTYQVKWDKETGKLFTGGGIIGFGDQGMSLNIRKRSEHGEDALRPHIKWFESGVKIMELGSNEPGEGRLALMKRYTGDEVNALGAGDVPVQMFSFDITGDANDSRYGPGIQVYNVYPGTNNLYVAPSDGEHRFFVGSKKVAGIGDNGMSFSLPFTLTGSEATSHWTTSGRFVITSSSLFSADAPEPNAYFEIVGGELIPQFQISNEDGLFTRLRVGANGTTWTTTGNIVLGPATNAIIPYVPYGVDLGSPFNRFGSLYAAQLEVETLVAQTRLATIGGRIVVAPTTQLVWAVEPSNTVFYLKDNVPVVDDICILEGSDGLEAVKINSITPFTNIDPYTDISTTRYECEVTRDLNGDGALAWDAGSAIVVTGHTTAAGWIDLYSTSGLAQSSTYGPTIVGNMRQSSTWNNWKERWAIGNLNGLYGYSATSYGVAFGNPAATHITIDDTNGYRLLNNATVIADWDASGNLTLGATGAIELTVAGDATFSGTINASAGYITGFLAVGTGTFTPPS